MIRFLAILAVDSHQFHSSTYVHDGLGKSSILCSFADCIAGFFSVQGKGFHTVWRHAFLAVKNSKLHSILLFFWCWKNGHGTFPSEYSLGSCDFLRSQVPSRMSWFWVNQTSLSCSNFECFSFELLNSILFRRSSEQHPTLQKLVGRALEGDRRRFLAFTTSVTKLVVWIQKGEVTEFLSNTGGGLNLN